MDAHWNNFYAEAAAMFRGPWYQPTQFARLWRDRLGTHSRVLDLGCGNGRDTVHLASGGHSLIGIDRSQDAISLARAFAAYRDIPCRFKQGDFTALGDLPRWATAAYSRFSLHSVPAKVQEVLLQQLAMNMQPPGLLLIEARSAPAGAAGHIETHDGHYRRLLHGATLQRELEETGFHIVHLEQVTGEPFGGDCPDVLRVAAVCCDVLTLPEKASR